MSPVASTRWCPTPEQVMILEEMYRGGVRTPNAAQIQQITAHLSLYGKIEGKNVFYWFQNHKARDRQKLRKRLLGKQLQQQQQMMFHVPPNLDHHQYFQQQNPHFIHSLHSPFDKQQPSCCSPTPLNFPQFVTTSPCFAPHPQASLEDNFARMANTYTTWKEETTTYAKLELEKEKSMRNTNDNDWMMMRGDDHSHHDYHHHHHHHHDQNDDESSTKRPLKTLELFPLKDKTSLKLG